MSDPLQAWLSARSFAPAELTIATAFEAGRRSVLGNLSEPVYEAIRFDGEDMMPTTSSPAPCPLCPGPTRHPGEFCDECAAYVGSR